MRLEAYVKKKRRVQAKTLLQVRRKVINGMLRRPVIAMSRYSKLQVDMLKRI